MQYDFDRVIERRGSGSAKYDLSGPDVIPLWVADMDFASPPDVKDALVKRALHGIYGYGVESEEFFKSFIDWQYEKNRWVIDPASVLYSPGVVTSLYMAVEAFTKEGDAVIIQPPVYRPFFLAVEDTGRKLVCNPLVASDGLYRMDLDDAERKIRETGAKLLILCSPHNPVGRVWEAAELAALGKICRKYGVVVVSDEIHSDLVFDGYTHVPFLSVSPDFKDMSCVFAAPSKTFNIPGLKVSFAVIEDPTLRERFKRACTRAALGEPSIFGPVASIAAYRKGGPWLRAVMHYIDENRRIAESFFSSRLPAIKYSKLQGTYLMWLDFRALGLSEPELDKLLHDKGKVWLQKGSFFGNEGDGFFRLNIGCPRSVLEEGLERIASALT